MIELHYSPLMLVALVCAFVAVGFLFAIGGADPGPLGFAGLLCVVGAFEGLWFRATVTGDGVVIRSLRGGRRLRWDEGLRGTLRARSGWVRDAVEAPAEAEELVLWTADGRRRVLPSSLVGFQALVADLERRGRLTTASPPPTMGDRLLRAFGAVVVAGWTFVCLAVLVGVAVGVGVLATGGIGSGTLAAVGVLAAWLGLAYGWDVATGDRLLDDVAAWGMTGAGLVGGAGLLLAAWTGEDREYALPLGFVGLAVAGAAVLRRVRGLRG